MNRKQWTMKYLWVYKYFVFSSFYYRNHENGQFRRLITWKIITVVPKASTPTPTSTSISMAFDVSLTFNELCKKKEERSDCISLYLSSVLIFFFSIGLRFTLNYVTCVIVFRSFYQSTYHAYQSSVLKRHRVMTATAIRFVEGRDICHPYGLYGYGKKRIKRAYHEFHYFELNRLLEFMLFMNIRLKCQIWIQNNESHGTSDEKELVSHTHNWIKIYGANFSYSFLQILREWDQLFHQYVH